MRLVDRLRHRADSCYGSEHEELRGLLNMAADRIEAADGVLRPYLDNRNENPFTACACRSCCYVKLVREQDGE